MQCNAEIKCRSIITVIENVRSHGEATLWPKCFLLLQDTGAWLERLVSFRRSRSCVVSIEHLEDPNLGL